jgi:hypothetical protein
MVEFTTIKGPRLGLGGTGEIVVDGHRANVADLPTNDGAADSIQIAEITTAGGNTVSAGSLQEVLQAIADLADPGE